jgi:hypothetical protein
MIVGYLILCVFHVCSRKEYFDDFQGGKNFNASIVGMSSGDVMFNGMVKIKVFDGAVLTLGSVAHNLEISKNFQSYG